MATIALVTPLAALDVPSEQTDVLPASTDKLTVSPEEDSAATVNAP
jgi:hypothetical protein